MSLILQIPPGTQFYQPVARFSAAFGVPTPGFYDFDIPGNTDVTLQPIKKQHLYLLERYSFSASVAEGAYLESTAGGIVPTLEIRIPTQKRRLIYPNPIPLINYFDGLECLMFAYAEQDQYLTATFRGQLTQPGALIGVADITAQVQFNIYEIRNKDWIEHFLGKTKHGQARGLVLNPGQT